MPDDYNIFGVSYMDESGNRIDPQTVTPYEEGGDMSKGAKPSVATLVIRIEMVKMAGPTDVHELADLTRKAADDIDRGVDDYGRIFDANGSAVGKWDLVREKRISRA